MCIRGRDRALTVQRVCASAPLAQYVFETLRKWQVDLHCISTAPPSCRSHRIARTYNTCHAPNRRSTSASTSPTAAAIKLGNPSQLALMCLRVRGVIVGSEVHVRVQNANAFMVVHSWLQWRTYLTVCKERSQKQVLYCPEQGLRNVFGRLPCQVTFLDV